ncbi:MAG: signal recognition particle-docking protein FtsY [Gammaproteobacteria bacterium]
MIFKGKQATPPGTGLLGGLRTGLRRTRENLLGGLTRLITGKHKLDPQTLEEIEDLLLGADLGIEATTKLLADLKQRLQRHGEASDANTLLREELVALLRPVEQPLEIVAAGERPFVMLIVGVNGSGKTTTIGKIAHLLKRRKLSVALAAGDTFRAAAVEQLKAWGERNEIAVTAQDAGADSASVIYDALVSATARGTQVLIADTAGRLHTQSNLMEELKKVKRVLQKLDPLAPQEVMLVIDANSGQNVLNQVAQFHQTVGLTGITITKLDGTAKGGILFALAHRWPIPIRYIGVGERLEDLAPFEAEEFVDALIGSDWDSGNLIRP